MRPQRFTPPSAGSTAWERNGKQPAFSDANIAQDKQKINNEVDMREVYKCYKSTAKFPTARTRQSRLQRLVDKASRKRRRREFQEILDAKGVISGSDKKHATATNKTRPNRLRQRYSEDCRHGRYGSFVPVAPANTKSSTSTGFAGARPFICTFFLHKTVLFTNDGEAQHFSRGGLRHIRSNYDGCK